jgi:hypothetical protein
MITLLEILPNIPKDGLITDINLGTSEIFPDPGGYFEVLSIISLGTGFETTNSALAPFLS